MTRGRKFVEPHRLRLRSSDRIPAVSPERNAEVCHRYDYPNPQFFKVPVFMLFDVSRVIWFGCRWPGKGHGATDKPRYKDASLPIEDRVADLLPRLTLEEKIEQISSGWESKLEVIDPTGTYTSEQARKIILNTWGTETPFTPRQSAILRNGVQRYQREKTRLGIPVIFMGEGLHGLMEYGSTSFPQALGLASTWDPILVKKVFTAVGDEAGSRGVGQVFSPVLDIARDPRWGRTEETYGEDPYLASRMGVSAIEGLQGDGFMIGRHRVMATAKHFAVHGQPEGGTNTAPGNYSERDHPGEFPCSL